MIPSDWLRCSRCPSHSTSCDASLLHARHTWAHLKRSEGGRRMKTTSCITSDQSGVSVLDLARSNDTDAGSSEPASASIATWRSCDKERSKEANGAYFSSQSRGSPFSGNSVLISTSVMSELSFMTSSSMSCLQCRRLLLPASCQRYFGASSISRCSSLCPLLLLLPSLLDRSNFVDFARNGNAVTTRKSQGTPALAIRGEPCTSFAMVKMD
mmetsp:Transcript_36059/g.72328  ORF Transcript_36059/g.72328 Transcript_36059/m.72328 type:complete len:212 (-) Transcript_36059:83-718(-)